MGRREELDNMTEADKVADLISSLDQHGCIRIDNRHAMAFWGSAIQKLVDDGVAESELIENYEGQYSYLKVTPVSPAPE